MNKKRIICIILTVLFAVLLYYITLPALNITAPGFYAYIIVILVFYFILDNLSFSTTSILTPGKLNIKSIGVIYAIALIVVGLFVVNFVCSPFFNADSYASRINIDETGNFSEGISEVDFNRIPLLDKDSSEKLGDRKMGEKNEWVSQFTVSSLYTQITYNDEIIRVTPIEYASFIKWFTNRSVGIKGYISVNSVNGESNIATLDKGIKYTESAYFNDDLTRKLRFSYPTKIFGEISFEIDNEGNPYYIVPTIKYTGIGLKKEVDEVIIFNPITGDSDIYAVKDVPEWVDHVYSADLIIEQVDNWGEYKNGFFNSIFGQKNVTNTTEGYNYLSYNDDIFLYTGITSVSNDESNLGFILANLRTKETIFYSAPGAEEFSAMSSAEGLVQEKGYTSSFPLLINLEGKPTYLMSLKDNAGLVKMYAFVDVADYQKVKTSDSSLGILAAKEAYLKEFSNDEGKELQETKILVRTIKEAVINGNSYYYFTDGYKDGLDIYVVDINVDKYRIPFITKDTELEIEYYEESDNVKIIKKIK